MRLVTVEPEPVRKVVIRDGRLDELMRVLPEFDRKMVDDRYPTWCVG